MKKLFAIPTNNKKLCPHFGHCVQFAIIETNDEKIIETKYINPPVHQPGVYPKFLAEKGVNTIISGGMGVKAQDLFNMNDIEVVTGINSDVPEILVNQYFAGQLESNGNFCDH